MGSSLPNHDAKDLERIEKKKKKNQRKKTKKTQGQIALDKVGAKKQKRTI